MASIFDNICSLPLPSDLFAQVLHPTLPILTVGLASGHVHTYQLPPAGDDDSDIQNETEPAKQSNHINETSDGLQPAISGLRRSSVASENGLGSIDTIWKTKRHKGSCRALALSHDGEFCYSAGTDGLVKSFLADTGRVVAKISVPQISTSGRSRIDEPTLLHVLSPQGLLLGTDEGRLYYHDLRQGGREIETRPAQTWTPHEGEHISGLVPLPASEASTSGFPKQWVSVGGSTLAVTDMRKGIVSTSEDQEAELTSVMFVGGLKKGGTNVGEKIVVGQGDGVASLWERGVWDDQDERIILHRGEAAVETMCEVPMEWARSKLKMNEKIIAVGLDDGRIRFVRIGRNGVVHEWDVKHDELDGVAGLGFDATGRMVSGGGQVVKVWTEAKGAPGGSSVKKHTVDSDDSDEEMDDSSDDEVAEKGKRKKRKRNRGKDKSGGKALDFSL